MRTTKQTNSELDHLSICLSFSMKEMLIDYQFDMYSLLFWLVSFSHTKQPFRQKMADDVDAFFLHEGDEVADLVDGAPPVLLSKDELMQELRRSNAEQFDQIAKLKTLADHEAQIKHLWEQVVSYMNHPDYADELTELLREHGDRLAGETREAKVCASSCLSCVYSLCLSFDRIVRRAGWRDGWRCSLCAERFLLFGFCFCVQRSRISSSRRTTSGAPFSS